ncbi:alpha/beta fold hydrolase [Spongiibacter sp.]|uniref:alpha/beta fold hydrolase n=1 Tax=Spongiibacter sp. TaxID=2024860 RepID=UPI0035684F0E
MNAPLSAQADAGAMLDQMHQQFLAGPLARYDAAALQAWRPLRHSLWRRLQPLMSLQAGMRSASVRIDDHQLSYWQGGNLSGPTLLLLHGFGASRENWAFIAPHLASQFRLLVPDLPGFGGSEFRFGADYALGAQVDRLAALIQTLNCGPVFVAGSSMGGAIAAQLAARHPDCVSAVCLMNAAGAPGRRMSVLESGVAAGRNYLAPQRRGDAAMVFQICLHRRHRLLGMGLSWVMAGEMCHRHPVNHYLFGHLVASLQDTWQRLVDIQAPTFVLWGDSDRVLDPSCSDVFAERIADCQVMVMPGVGHLPMLEEPAETARLLRDFWISKTEYSV